MADYLKQKGRKAIFWGDVIYKDGYPLPDNVVIQWWNWRGHRDLALKNAIRHNYPVICGTNYYTYLNFPLTPWKGYTKLALSIWKMCICIILLIGPGRKIRLFSE